jgi:hypothetical protein
MRPPFGPANRSRRRALDPALPGVSARLARDLGVKEAPIVAAILKRLKLERVWSWKANAGTIVIGKGRAKRVVRGSPAGTPDILLVLPGGRLAGLEVKRPVGGRVSPKQSEWHAKAELHQVRVAVVRSVIEALEAVRKWRAE